MESANQTHLQPLVIYLIFTLTFSLLTSHENESVHSFLILNTKIYYRIHSNKRLGRLDKSLQVGAYLFQIMFVARINPKIYDFGHIQANSQLY